MSDGKEVSKGYCFFEYVNPKHTKLAIKGLDGFQVGDKRLRVSIASEGVNQLEKMKLMKKKKKRPPANEKGSYLETYAKYRDPLI